MEVYRRMCRGAKTLGPVRGGGGGGGVVVGRITSHFWEMILGYRFQRPMVNCSWALLLMGL